MPIKWKLAAVMKRKHITAYELARRMGVKHPTIYRLAKRDTVTRISGETLLALCKALDCQPGDLMSR